MSYCCNCRGPQIHDTVKSLLKLTANNEKILKAYMLDFFVENHWELLPESWRTVLENLNAVQLGEWILYPQPFNSYKEVWPLSLMALRTAVRHLSLERQPKKGSSSSPAPSAYCAHCPHEAFLGPSSNPGLNAKIYSKHIKPKKFHEIEIMAEVTKKSAENAGCEYILDIGSGLGHLGRILAFHYGLKVCCLEEQTCLTEKARKIDEQMLKIMPKSKSNILPPIHINKSIKAALQQEELVQVVKSAFGIDQEANFKFGLVGLHPCGDLGPTLMRLLVDCPEASFINLVGCCYMKLTDEKSGSEVYGYPMSDFVLQSPSHSLSYEAREVCCHALEMYCERLQMGCVDDLKVHCFRSTAECIIVKHWPHLRHSGLKSIKHVQNMTFERYANEAVEKLGIDLPQDELSSSEVQLRLSQWMRVVIFYSMRLLVAPLVESVILLDRLLYLEEKGMECVLVPAFNPKFSPRNHILVAFKK